MRVSNGCWVSVRYRLFDAVGEPVEDGERELTYLHGGYGEVFDAIEAALEGKQAGEKISVNLQPHESFGDYDADLVSLVDRDQLPEQIEPGMTFSADAIGHGDFSDDPDRVYVVTDISDQVVVIDGNHPLAGMALRYDLEVLSVRAASAEEIAQSELERDHDAKNGAPPTLH